MKKVREFEFDFRKEITDETEFFITKGELTTIFRTLKCVYEYNLFDPNWNEPILTCQDRENVEELLSNISSTIHGNTRKYWQLVKYNNPSYSQCYDRKQYGHYGTYPPIKEETYPHKHTIGEF